LSSGPWKSDNIRSVPMPSIALHKSLWQFVRSYLPTQLRKIRPSSETSAISPFISTATCLADNTLENRAST